MWTFGFDKQYKGISSFTSKIRLVKDEEMTGLERLILSLAHIYFVHDVVIAYMVMQ